MESKDLGINGLESECSNPQQFNTSIFLDNQYKWTGESDYVKLADSVWVSEDRQTSTFNVIEPDEFVNVSLGRWFADFGKASFANLQSTINSLKDNEII